MAAVLKRTWTHNGAEKSAWVVRYRDRTGANRQKTFERKKDADAYRNKVAIELQTGMHMAAADKLTLAFVAEDFEQTIAERQRDGRIGENHRRRASAVLRLHVLPVLRGYKIGDVNLAVLHDWHRGLIRDNGLSPNSARASVRVLKMVFDHAERRQWVPRNPVVQLLNDLRGLRIEPIRTFGPDDLRAILDELDRPSYQGMRGDAGLRLKIAVHLAAFCGLRRGEIFGLRFANLDLEARVVRVRNNLSVFDGLKAPKTAAGVRDVAIPTHLVALLREWVQRYYVADAKLNPPGLLLTYRNGSPFVANSLRQGSWGSLLKRAGLSTDHRRPSFHFHALRHFAASSMVEAGWSLPVIARQLGHRKFDTTLAVYTHALDGGAIDLGAAQALADGIRGAPLRVVNG